MDLLVKDAARLLNVSEKTIHRWTRQGLIPAYRPDEQYRFNRAELLGWAVSHRLSLSPEIFREPESAGVALPRVTEALRAGGVHDRAGGSDTAEVLRQVVATLPLPEGVDREFLHAVLLARETLGYTPIGDGIAIPRVRNPVILRVGRPVMTLTFLDRPVDFGSPDGGSVRALFTLVSPTVRAHLHLLSRLSFLVRDPAFRMAVVRRDAPGALLAAAERCEGALDAAPDSAR